MYGLFVIVYLFLGGISSGAFFLMSLKTLIRGFNGSRNPSPATSKASLALPARPFSPAVLRARRAQESLTTSLRVISLGLLLVAIVCLFFDLGRPERVLAILTGPRLTVLSFGTYCLITEFILGLTLTLLSLLRITLTPLLENILHACCCVASFATFTYTGVFLASSIGIAFWNTWTVVPLFVFSSLSGALALIAVVSYFFPQEKGVLGFSRSLQGAHLFCILLEAVFLVLFLYTAWQNPLCTNAVGLLLSGRLLPVALVGVAGFGLLIPAADSLWNTIKPGQNPFPMSDVLCLCGGFLLRYCMVVCGVF